MEDDSDRSGGKEVSEDDKWEGPPSPVSRAEVGLGA